MSKLFQKLKISHLYTSTFRRLCIAQKGLIMKKKQTVNILVAQTFDQNIYHVLKIRANFGPR